MKKNPLQIKARVARAAFGASLLALAASPGYGQGGNTGAQAGGGSAGTTTGAGTSGTGTGTTSVGTGATGLGTGSLGGQGNKGTPGTPGTGTHAAPFGTGTRQPIPAGSSPPSNTTITNPTGTYDSGGNPVLTSPADNGKPGTVPAYDVTPNTNPAATPPANAPNDPRGAKPAGSGTGKQGYR